ncbi:zona occludens toxin [Herbaspirillum sp. Sphag1AN]|uniref:zonular occludens toxin domain-containing protein n=1 Tax=unclassified Herbaspirillum TaxID=2624150 RepID=UPI00161B8A5F|nr:MULTISPECIES: zonular occludens toxin domain-containing protein [unclassified Herbaspirillum]MBB3212682.1 zona occludens toxin [Herbaspirillum sp. Sphag1AN]MBB3245879.1 zona occludens toxin [Herbaspirillum sp. Sphag64]
MLQLITGLPGNGKTLYALAYIKQWAEKDHRTVFYSGIAELTLDWTEIEAEKWYDCPPNSIVVIDECQRVFRPRSLGSQVPEHVARLETHRHQGLDIVLITQHPMLADTAIRRLVGKHMHIVRKFGTQNATIHEWGSVKDNCDKPAAKKDSIKHHWRYDKKLFSVYKSADVHTVKRSIPMKIYFFAAIPFLLAAAVWYLYQFAQSKIQAPSLNTSRLHTKQEPPLSAFAHESPNSQSLNSQEHRRLYQNAVEDAKQYIYERTPRLEGLAFTAPHYDKLTQPVRVPRPSGCLSSIDQCACHTEDGTPLNMPENVCRNIVNKGLFIDF